MVGRTVESRIYKRQEQDKYAYLAATTQLSRNLSPTPQWAHTRTLQWAVTLLRNVSAGQMGSGHQLELDGRCTFSEPVTLRVSHIHAGTTTGGRSVSNSRLLRPPKYNHGSASEWLPYVHGEGFFALEEN